MDNLLTSLLVFLALVLLTNASEDPQDVKVKPGGNITLDCQHPTQAPIEVLKWIRPDLKSDHHYVYFFRDDLSYESYQHEPFRGRVELRDPEMKDGDVSVILKKVTINDTGTYECYVSMKSTTHKKRSQSELWCIISITVDSGHTTGHIRNGGLAVGLLIVVVLLVVGIVIFVIKCKQETEEKENLIRKDTSK